MEIEVDEESEVEEAKIFEVGALVEAKGLEELELKEAKVGCFCFLVGLSRISLVLEEAVLFGSDPKIAFP